MQFTQGFIACVLEEPDANIRQNILEYFQQLIQDAQETNWFTAKSAHKVLLIEMERGKITWKDARLINQITARYTQKTIHPVIGEKKSDKQALPCKFFNKGNWKGKSYRDMCVHSVFEWSNVSVFIVKLIVTGNRCLRNQKTTPRHSFFIIFAQACIF